MVTDHDAYRRLVNGCGFLIPEKVKVFDVAEQEDAKAWVAEPN